MSKTQNSKTRNRKDRIDEKESDRHYKQKLRLASIFIQYGWHPTVERRMPYTLRGLRRTYRFRYRVDCFAWKGRGSSRRRIIAEVDGKLGHKTKQAYTNDELRSYRIRERYGWDIKVHRFTFRRLSAWTDEEIAEEMRLNQI